MNYLAAKLYELMDKGLLRALSLILSLLLAVCVFWDPARFAAKTSTLQIWQGGVVIWAVCSGVIYGVGFRPNKLIWQVFFCPLVAMIVLLLGIGYYFF